MTDPDRRGWLKEDISESTVRRAKHADYMRFMGRNAAPFVDHDSGSATIHRDPSGNGFDIDTRSGTIDLIRNHEPVASMAFINGHFGSIMVNAIETIVKGKGYGKDLYSLVLRDLGFLLSGSLNQTEYSRRAWSWIANQPDLNVIAVSGGEYEIGEGGVDEPIFPSMSPYFDGNHQKLMKYRQADDDETFMFAGTREIIKSFIVKQGLKPRETDGGRSSFMEAALKRSLNSTAVEAEIDGIMVASGWVRLRRGWYLHQKSNVKVQATVKDNDSGGSYIETSMIRGDTKCTYGSNSVQELLDWIGDSIERFDQADAAFAHILELSSPSIRANKLIKADLDDAVLSTGPFAVGYDYNGKYSLLRMQKGWTGRYQHRYTAEEILQRLIDGTKAVSRPS